MDFNEVLYTALS